MVIGKGNPEELEALEPPLRIPRRQNLPNIGFGSEAIKTVIISLITAFVVIMGMGFAGGGSFVTKKDFEANLAGITASVEQAKADVAKAKSDVLSASQGIPGTVATYVNNAVTQSTGQWNSQLSALSDKVTSSVSNSQSNATKIGELTTKLTNDVNSLTAKITELTTKITTLEETIKALQDKVTALETKITVSGTSPTGTGVTLIGESPLLVYTTAQGSYPTNQFSVKAANADTAYRYFSFTVSFAAVSAQPITVTSSNLTSLGGTLVVFTSMVIPPSPSVQQVIFYQNTPKFAVAPGQSMTIPLWLDIKTTEAEQWEGTVSAIVSSTW